MKATHPSTLEVTKEADLTPRGDCIIAVSSTKAAADLPLDFKEIARRENCMVKLTIEAEGMVDEVVGYGSPRLSFLSGVSMVFRRSEYVCPRTVMVKASKAALHLDRRLVEELKDPSTVVRLRLEAWTEARR